MIIVVPVILIVVGAGGWFLAKSIAAKGAQGVGIFTIAVGTVGIALSLLSLIDYRGTREMHAAALIASSIIFGCGAIATVIAKNKE